MRVPLASVQIDHRPRHPGRILHLNNQAPAIAHGYTSHNLSTGGGGDGGRQLRRHFGL